METYRPQFLQQLPAYDALFLHCICTYNQEWSSQHAVIITHSRRARVSRSALWLK
jgi:hypothetical protein